MSLIIYENSDHEILVSQKNHADLCHVRSMCQTDIPTVAEIDRDTWQNESWPIENFHDALDKPDWSCWTIESTESNDHTILGYGLQFVSDDTSHIACICIRSDRRGCGLGGILLRHMIDHAIRMDTSVVVLEVLTTNKHALDLYHKHGFKISEFLAEYYSADADGYRMHLVINRKNTSAVDHYMELRS